MLGKTSASSSQRQTLPCLAGCSPHPTLSPPLPPSHSLHPHPQILSMASVVGEREIDLSKLSIEQLNQLKTQLGEVREYGGRERGREEGRVEASSQLSPLNDRCVHVSVDAPYMGTFSFAYIHVLPSSFYAVCPPSLWQLLLNPPSLPPSLPPPHSQ